MSKGQNFLLVFGVGILVGLLGLTILIWMVNPSPVLPPDGTYQLARLRRNEGTIWGETSYHVTYYIAATTVQVKLPRDTPVVTTFGENKMVVADGRATLYTNWRDFDSADYSNIIIYFAVGGLALFFGAATAALFR